MRYSTVPIYEPAARELAFEVINGGGCTWPEPPATGYMVSMEDLELQIPQHIFEFGGHWFILGYMAYVSDHLCNGKYFGAWTDNGVVYLDLNVWVQDKAEALDVARLNRQIAVYGLAEGESVYLVEVA